MRNKMRINFLKFFTKGSKLIKILIKIYKGLYVSSQVMNSLTNSISEVSNTDKIDGFFSVSGFLESVTNMIGKILYWFEIDQESMREINLDEGSELMARKCYLDNLTTDLKVEENNF